MEVSAYGIDFGFSFFHCTVIPDVVIWMLVAGEHDVRQVCVMVRKPDDESHRIVRDVMVFDSPQVVLVASLVLAA